MTQIILQSQAALSKRGRRISEDGYCNSVTNLATSYYNTRQFDKAEPHYRQVLDYRRGKLQNGDSDLRDAYQNLLDSLRAQGKEEEAQSLANEAKLRGCALSIE